MVGKKDFEHVKLEVQKEKALLGFPTLGNRQKRAKFEQ